MLTYNLENKPLTITIAGQTTTFVYDGDGGRVKKIAGTTTTRYISQLYECDNASCSRMIFADGQRIATIGASGAVYYYHTDHLGSSSVITDSTGAKVQSLTYFPFGATRTNTSTVTPAIDVPYKYTGQELDGSTGLYDYGARQYDASLGRFVSPDTMVPDPANPQSLNRYSYVRNNPFRYADPTGHMEIDGVGCIDCLPSSLFPLFPIVGQYGMNLPTSMVQGDFASYMTQSAFAPQMEVLEVPEVKVFPSEEASLNLAQMQTALSWAGFVPVLNTPAGLLNAGISLIQGNYGEASINALTAVPIVGMVGKVGVGFSSFPALKRVLGSAGEGRHWHHIVEQAQAGKFGREAIHSKDNVISLNVDLHNKVSAYYSSKPFFTEGQRVRDWLRSQSFDEQKEFGLRTIERILGNPK